MHRRVHRALAAYYYSTLPYRWVSERVRWARGTRPVRVLFYHRVADHSPNDWTIGTLAFARQIEWLTRHFTLVSLAEAQQVIASGTNRRRLAVLTFDDGYADNCDFAIPLLLRLGVPFTYFVSTRNVIEQLPFPHDEVMQTPLRPNTVEQIRAMAQAGVDIGAHTRTHCDLGAVADIDRLRAEITGSRRDLQDITQRSVDYFAFPYGHPANLSPLAFQVAYESGFRGVCSAYGGVNQPGRDPFHIERLHGDPDLLRIKNWLTIDPRRQMTHRSVDIGDYRQPVPPSRFAFADQPSLAGGANG